VVVDWDAKTKIHRYHGTIQHDMIDRAVHTKYVVEFLPTH